MPTPRDGGHDGGADGGADDGMDPVLGLHIRDGSRWMSASVLRTLEGFDAECLLAAARPPAEAAYFSALVLARSMAVASQGPRPERPFSASSSAGSLAPPFGALVARSKRSGRMRPRGGGTAVLPPPRRRSDS